MSQGNIYLSQKALIIPIAILTAIIGCNYASVRYNFQMLDKLRESVTSNDSTYDTYLLTGGKWISNQPIMVNRDFDFSLAQAIEDIGAGIAADKRSSENKKVVSKLNNVPAEDWNAILKINIQQCGSKCQGLKDALVRLYGILFCDVKARLQCILEIEKMDPSRVKDQKSVYRFVEVSEERPLEGDSGWLESQGKLILDTMKKTVPKLVSLYKDYGENLVTNTGPNAKVSKCPVGGNNSLKGGLIKEDEEEIIILVENMKKTIISCEHQVVKENKGGSP